MAAITITEIETAPTTTWLAKLIMNQTKPFSHKVTQKDWQSRIGEGSRNNELFRIGRSFSAKGLPLDDVACFLGYVNEKYCDPPVEKPELEAITKSVGRYHEKTESDNLPQIEVTGDLASMVSQVLTIMATHNDPPFIFQRSGLLVRVIKDDDDYPSIQNLSIDAVKGVLARMIHFVDIKRNENGEITSITTVHPPTTVVKDLMALLELPVPTLLRITESPVYGADRTLNTTPGYHGGSRTFFHASRKFDIPPVPSKPSQKQVNGARDFLLNELVVDFPFASEADRTHAMGAMTLPLVREMIVGNTPLHLIEAPSPGTGKSLLADIITIPVTGRSAPIMTEAHHEEEWRKRLTASLSEAPTFLMIDNIRQKLDSAALSAALTTQTWSDRILGRSEVITLPVKCTWLASGNNPILTTEMARRTVRIRLDSEHSRPWQRTEFKHANLRQWTLSNRNKILWCLLIMVQNWIALGCPQSSQTLGNYEQWANVIGGILENAGFEGFLDNLDEMYDAADEETREWEEFTNLWWNEHRSNAVGIRELFFLADDFDLMLPFRGAGNENSQKTRLGRALSQNAGRKFGPFTIVKAAKRGPGSALMHHLQKDG